MAVEALVDDVVAAYHSGFSASIENYSRILALFSDAQRLVAASARSLSDAGAHLASRRPALQAQWLRAATSAATVKLLDAVAHAAAFEERVAAALRDERPLDAVAGPRDTRSGRVLFPSHRIAPRTNAPRLLPHRSQRCWRRRRRWSGRSCARLAACASCARGWASVARRCFRRFWRGC